jgi:hypothetical protein
MVNFARVEEHSPLAHVISAWLRRQRGVHYPGQAASFGCRAVLEHSEDLASAGALAPMLKLTG